MNSNKILPEPLVGTKEIAAHLDVTKETIHKWIKSGNIPCSRVGKLWKFKISQVDEWVQNGGASNID